jgi:glc operon protein GlcG
MVVIRIGPRCLALLGIAAALAVGMLLGSLRPVDLVAAAGRAAAPDGDVLPAPSAQMNGVTYEQAQRMIQAAMADSQSKNYLSAFVVLDGGGHVIASGRMDGARLNTMEFARGKAYASVFAGRPSGPLQESYTNNPGLWGNAASLGYGGPLLPSRGALPIMINGQVAGAMGASGGPGQEDENAVRAGLTAVGLP